MTNPETPDSRDLPEPVERLEEILPHPADKTINSLHDQGLLAKKELAEERHELGLLMAKLPGKMPAPGTKEHLHYQQTLLLIQNIKVRITKKHDQLMEILKTEERISREIQEKNQ